jgi:hypothetical protein
MQDEARPRTANIVHDLLNETLGDGVISHRFLQYHKCGHVWPRQCPDINICYYFQWGFIKEELFMGKTGTYVERRDLDIQLGNTVSE